MKIVLSIARFIVGFLFIFSGLIKANDPSGLSYKMQEFFEVWNWHGLNDYTLALSILMIAFEIIAGVAVLLGWQMRLFSWLLLLLIIFFTFLTAYALFSGKIRSCGCFGDCIPLTAKQSFIKDLLLLVLILFIFMYHSQVKPLLNPVACIAILLATTIFSFASQWYVLKYLPVVDCLPYKVGKNIPEQMKNPPGAIPDSTVITYQYEKQGRQIEFTADKFPADFDDSLYHFVKRYDKLVRKGNAEPPIKDFSLQTTEGNDTTQALLAAPGHKIFLFTKGFEKINESWVEEFRKIHKLAIEKNIMIYFITNDFANVTDWIAKNGFNGIQVLKCDFVAIKTAARANPTLYLLQDATIVNKWSYADFDDIAEALQAIGK
jgi:uncharacterized membrane protein YphA (DoxX/SURF4 family)